MHHATNTRESPKQVSQRFCDYAAQGLFKCFGTFILDVCLTLFVLSDMCIERLWILTSSVAPSKDAAVVARLKMLARPGHTNWPDGRVPRGCTFKAAPRLPQLQQGDVVDVGGGVEARVDKHLLQGIHISGGLQPTPVPQRKL